MSKSNVKFLKSLSVLAIVNSSSYNLVHDLTNFNNLRILNPLITIKDELALDYTTLTVIISIVDITIIKQSN